MKVKAINFDQGWAINGCKHYRVEPFKSGFKFYRGGACVARAYDSGPRVRVKFPNGAVKHVPSLIDVLGVIE